MTPFIRELISWIEQNLDERMLLEHVSLKAGYSKWYLQRMFREVTGLPLGTYIRQRKLFKSAMLLRMTSLPVMEIACRFGYSTQQDFTRAFKRHFGVAPGRYREARYWHFRGLLANMTWDKCLIPPPEVVNLPAMSLTCTTMTYLCDAESLESATFHATQRSKAAQKSLRLLTAGHNVFVTELREPARVPGKIKIELSVCSGNQTEITERVHSLKTEGGNYFRFALKGGLTELIRMQMHIYWFLMPFQDRARRTGMDLFEFSDAEDPALMSGYYYVPVTEVTGLPSVS